MSADMKKGLVYFAALSAALIAQTSVFPVFFSDFSVLKITLMLVLVWVIRDGFIRTLPWIIAAGLLTDIVSYAPAGAAVIFFVLVSYAADLFSRKFLVEGENWGALAIFFFIIAVTVFYRFFIIINLPLAGEFSGTITNSLVFFRRLGSEAALNCFLFFLILLVFKKKNERIFSVKKVE